MRHSTGPEFLVFPTMDGLGSSADTEGLRQRNIPVQVDSSEEARQAVLQLNALEERSTRDKGRKKTYGRTASGTGE